jgi:tRNA nucleotidyltransferase (CCA-adding enzyme)
MFFEKQGREGLIPKKVSETVRPKQGQTYERLTTVYVKPEVPEFVNDWLKNFDAQIPIYLVGGSVRDSILGKAPKDIDVITFNSKQDVENNLKSSSTKFYQGGKNLPNLLTANLGKDQLVDIISMGGDIETELVRRDFTINAMAQRPDGEIVDPFGGRQDLKNGVLKSPKGDSDKVFSEDPIRMLRAARFIGDLNLKADRSLTDSLKKQKDLLADMPKERIGMEFGRIMYSKDPVSALKFLKDNDLLKHIDPALQRMVGFVQNLEGHDFDTWNHTLKALAHHITKDKDKPDLATRLGILYHNVGKPPAANEKQ